MTYSCAACAAAFPAKCSANREWEALFQQWLTSVNRAKGYYPKGREADWVPPIPSVERSIQEQLETQARTALENRTLTDVCWLIESYEGNGPEQKQKQEFILYSVKQATHIPEQLVEPLLKASLYQDPSFNAEYIYPCLRSFGPRKINEILLRYFETGTNEEKIGAVFAFYWSLRDFQKPTRRFGVVPYENIDDLRARIWYAFLTMFLHNEDVSLRRHLIGKITRHEFTDLLYPEDTPELLRQALRIARSKLYGFKHRHKQNRNKS